MVESAPNGSKESPFAFNLAVGVFQDDFTDGEMCNEMSRNGFNAE
jgi:hypothetical protein